MVGIKLQLICGVRIELAIGSLPYLAWYSSRSPFPLWVLKVPSEEEGLLPTRQPLGLEVETRNRGLPINGLGSMAHSNKQERIRSFVHQYICPVYSSKCS